MTTPVDRADADAVVLRCDGLERVAGVLLLQAKVLRLQIYAFAALTLTILLLTVVVAVKV